MRAVFNALCTTFPVSQRMLGLRSHFQGPEQGKHEVTGVPLHHYPNWRVQPATRGRPQGWTIRLRYSSNDPTPSSGIALKIPRFPTLQNCTSPLAPSNYDAKETVSLQTSHQEGVRKLDNRLLGYEITDVLYPLCDVDSYHAFEREAFKYLNIDCSRDEISQIPFPSVDKSFSTMNIKDTGYVCRKLFDNYGVNSSGRQTPAKSVIPF